MLTDGTRLLPHCPSSGLLNGQVGKIDRQRKHVTFRLRDS